MRVPYISNPPPVASPEEEAIVAAIAARRHPRPLQPLDLALLHSPTIANGWNTFVGAVREHTSLPDDLRELAICRIAVVNRAWYEWMHHAPLAVKAGVSSEAMEKLKVDRAWLGVALDGTCSLFLVQGRCQLTWRNQLGRGMELDQNSKCSACERNPRHNMRSHTLRKTGTTTHTAVRDLHIVKLNKT
ncbi:putative carboxymuconolactone decarboxylase protein [Ilyonectria robusta]